MVMLKVVVEKNQKQKMGINEQHLKFQPQNQNTSGRLDVWTPGLTNRQTLLIVNTDGNTLRRNGENFSKSPKTKQNKRKKKGKKEEKHSSYKYMQIRLVFFGTSS